MHRGSEEARSDQLGRDPHSAEREQEEPGPGAQPPSEAATEPTIGDGQDGGDVDDRVRSGRSGGKSWFSCRTAVPLTATSQGERLG